MTHLRKIMLAELSDVITRRLPHATISVRSKDSHNTSTALPIASARDIFGNTKPNCSQSRSCRLAR